MAAQSLDSPMVGVDLGGTKILVGVVDRENKILSRAKRSTPAKTGGEAILREIASGVEEAIAEAGITVEEIGGVGVGSPGPLDSERGVILFSANMAVRDFPLGPDLARFLGRPVLVENDVRVGGYGEFRLGAGKGHKNLLAAFVGTGIGGCVIINGEVVRGLTGNAGEIGHIVIKANGPRCGCGRRGCLEAMASRTAMTRRIRKAISKGQPSSLEGQLGSKSATKLKSRELASAYQLRDPVVVKEVQRAAHYLGLGLGSLVNVLSPEMVIVGGGVAEAIGEPYLEIVRVSAHETILADPENKTQIVLAALGDDAGILGGALLAREKFCKGSK